MSESSSGSDDDFAAELEAQMTVADTPAKTPAPPKSAVVIAAPPAPSSRGGLDALLRGAAQKAEVRAFAAAAPPAGAAPPRRAVKRRRVPAPSASGAGETVSATARPDSEGGAGGTTVSSCPPHPGFLHDICVRCGTRREKPSSRGGGSGFGGREGGGVPKSTSMRYIHAGLELSNDELEKAKREEKQRVLLSGKLLLVLDLDHTLLNSARFAELTQAEHDVLGRIIAARACADAGGSEAEIRKAASEAIEADLSIEPADVADVADVANGAARKKEASADEETRETRPDGDEAIPPEPSRTETEQTEQERTEQRTYPGCVPPLKHTHCLRHLALFTKLRPRVHAFLRAASRLCQLYIYTMGDKRYAAEMAHLLDPSGDLFSGRIISNEESTNARVKDLDIVLGAEPAVLIVDDTDRVWPNNLRNLIRVDRYHFFSQSARGFRQPGAAVADKNWVDEGEPLNGTRLALRDVLVVIASAHRLFFAGTDASGRADEALRVFSADEDSRGADGAGPSHEPHPPERLPASALETLRARDVRELLLGGGGTGTGELLKTDPARTIARPLSRASIAFSRITARGEPFPERHPLWLMASSAGATCSVEIIESSTANTPKTTHVVTRRFLEDGSNAPRTEKTKWASRNGARAVDAEWLARCAEAWRRVPEAPYSLFDDADGNGSIPETVTKDPKDPKDSDTTETRAVRDTINNPKPPSREASPGVSA
jgi:RNA polymerase II C-terminal domain phosphatase-like 3/4